GNHRAARQVFGPLGLGDHQRHGHVADRCDVVVMPRRARRVDPDHRAVARLQPLGDVLARGRLLLRRDRVLQVEHHGVRAAGGRFGEPIRAIARDEQQCASAGQHRHAITTVKRQSRTGSAALTTTRRSTSPPPYGNARKPVTSTSLVSESFTCTGAKWSQPSHAVTATMFGRARVVWLSARPMVWPPYTSRVPPAAAASWCARAMFSVNLASSGALET